MLVALVHLHTKLTVAQDNMAVHRAILRVAAMVATRQPATTPPLTTSLVAIQQLPLLLTLTQDTVKVTIHAHL